MKPLRGFADVLQFSNCNEVFKQAQIQRLQMAKTIVGTLAGVAISEHTLGSTADTAPKYVPELKDPDCGKVTVRDLLHMSSGVTCQMDELDHRMEEIREAQEHDFPKDVKAAADAVISIGHLTAPVYSQDDALVCFLLAAWSFRRRSLARV